MEIVLSPIPASNSVGYQKQTTPDSSYQMVVPTFVNLTDAPIPLKNFTARSLDETRFELENFQLIFFGSDGSTMKVKDDETMKTFCSAAYSEFGESDLKLAIRRSNGWFLADDSGRTYSMNDYPIAPGRGFNISVSGHSAGVEFTSAGAVSSEDFSITVPDSSYSMSGNAMPVDVALEDLVVTSLDGTRFELENFQLIFFGSDGSTMKVKDDDYMKEHFSAAVSEFGESDLKLAIRRSNGWFIADDSGRTYSMNKYVIKAGRGFNISVSGHAAGVKLTIPSPLQDNKEIK